jgi:hypothetical protein
MGALTDLRRTYGSSDIGRFNTTVSSSGDNTLVAASTGRKIRVITYNLFAASAVNAKFTSSTTSDLTKLHYMAAAELGKNFPWNPAGWFETVSGELLGVNLSGGVVVTVGGIYILI